ncbi:hypothetical protein ETB97_001358 [Aspergillus alliaceus]|uniref:CVNH domain-containing protein n=1 Tax=Petromyces alliaceus TaxID=209559 RepID=A0A5N6FTY3_PETAA|nr:uncharacterized protein BDW43DRAFT_311124 [Aspergillus alliaceus]KAB8233408.1 hypothetical protein BDW43DRAFT_311124 [Aspergillus alliaceus]KAE8395154.1 hypothetical protein BDV23DRAFT_179141 [Aspergillus alliaceus]KAF5860584.1 hypothetical protein ETB97_001358 [Aspergillus burnettii]
MRLLQALMLGTGLAMQAKAYELIFYDNVNDCNANDNSNYKIFDGNSEQCINLFDVPPSDASCSLYINGGASYTACTSDNFRGTSVYLSDLHTQVLGKNSCWSCTFYNERDCEVETYPPITTDKCNYRGGHGLASFKCGPSSTIGGC